MSCYSNLVLFMLAVFLRKKYAALLDRIKMAEFHKAGMQYSVNFHVAVQWTDLFW